MIIHLTVDVSKTDETHVEATVKNNTGNGTTVQFITAVYSPYGTLQQTILSEMRSVGADSSESITLEIPADADYKIMVRDSVTSMKPIYNVISGADIL
ncbi:MAG: hypothetical protein ACI4TH_09000 [Candidatus Ornithomonoglobus sp.]